ncbi:MAG: Mercuric resistance operon regulatory protein [Mycobacterium sp.]|nr:Mercuric resistance operon regulatory protein [Mycobacterium sp.]
MSSMHFKPGCRATSASRQSIALSESGLRSGEVADAAGVNIQTLRYYERRGLLHEPDRTLGGHRLYPPEAVTVLRVIKAAQRLGFTLDEVANLLEVSHLRADGRADAGLQARARVKLAEVDAKLAELTTVRDTLRAALDAGCDDLIACADSPCCPLPFAATIPVGPPMPNPLERHAKRWGLPAIGLAASACVGSAVWRRRIRTNDRCEDSADCQCASDPEAKMLQPNMFRPGP